MRFKKVLAIVCVAALSLAIFAGCAMKSDGGNYTIPQIDLSGGNFTGDAQLDYLFDYNVLDDGAEGGEAYMAHPDSVLIGEAGNQQILTFYPAGHGKGKILTKVAAVKDGSIEYGARLAGTPNSWEKSEETPTVYQLDFVSGEKKLVLISANPKWAGYVSGDGFNVSVSTNSASEWVENGVAWSEFRKFYGKDDKPHLSPIVAMSALVQLKENGEFVDKWMGIFHDNKFKNYKTILTFGEDGSYNWSKPEEYFKGADGDYFDIAKKTKMCEVEIIRSDGGKGDKLCLITRSNTKKYNSLISFSTDEGQTWSKPVEAPAALNGERHKAEYAPDGRLFITFRSIERDKAKVKKYASGTKKWYSEGWIAWVGTFDDLESGAEGQYRVKLAHTYLDKQSEIGVSANADTGYAGVVVTADGRIVTCSYGIFDKDKKASNGDRKTIIISKTLRLSDLDKAAAVLKSA